jgi:hypothetical protein
MIFLLIVVVYLFFSDQLLVCPSTQPPFPLTSSCSMTTTSATLPKGKMCLHTNNQSSRINVPLCTNQRIEHSLWKLFLRNTSGVLNYQSHSLHFEWPFAMQIGDSCLLYACTIGSKSNGSHLQLLLHHHYVVIVIVVIAVVVAICRWCLITIGQ